ncbi:hypothetical protein K437DRAFT_289675 [Tilletiaria anomala UBC 951]|uniref:protein-tyrosine-phosphatase n=1 Tax=Tilletiaria anomala (strain ATCC 24038 / CBS 436.72 / UBC 951) TaxID=1037660 RepID=A0A066WH32_TILAU|nr:uncharacterized protein K437DRAFT_289675 [Tilletiaria anomala UBC 951]KDN53136.1 hypothetical protein K437DRAFT_289675 [Tilletiaria anomala UBC 951]
MDEIIPGLWLGDLACALSPDYLDLAGVTHIVSALKQSPASLLNDESGVKLPSGRIIPHENIKQVRIDDVDGAPILVHFSSINELVDSVLQEEWHGEETEGSAQASSQEEAGQSAAGGDYNSIREQNVNGQWGHWETMGTGTVLVHCQAGISRSATLVAAYLMWRRGISTSAALELIRARRPQADPNSGFVAQLELYEQCDHQVDLRHKAVRRYLMSKTNILDGDSADDMLLSYYPSPYPSPGMHRNSMSMTFTKGNRSNSSSEEPTKSSPSISRASTYDGHSAFSAVDTASDPSSREASRNASRRGSVDLLSANATPARRPRTFSRTTSTWHRSINLSVSPVQSDQAAADSSPVGYFSEGATHELPPAYPSSSLAQPPSVEVKVTETQANARLPGGVSSLRGNEVRGAPSGGSSSGQNFAARVPTVTVREGAGVSGSGAGSSSALSRPVYSGPKLRCKMCRRELASTVDHLIEHEAGKGQMAFEHRKRTLPGSKDASAGTRLGVGISGSDAGSDGARVGAMTAAQSSTNVSASASNSPNQPGYATKPAAQPDAAPSLEQTPGSATGTVQQAQLSQGSSSLTASGRPIQSAASLSASLPPHLAALRMGRAGPHSLVHANSNSTSQAQAQGNNRPVCTQRAAVSLSLPSPLSLLPSAACSSYFVEPLSWMSALKNGEVSGRLDCPAPKCGAKLGSWDWAGMQCGCGAWITPAFALHRSKVDVLR